jgi:3-phenylpropionate/trans-cinnamate dioxygenase ferredoxin reductase subunit
MPERVVIVGAGQAAAQTVDTLRRKGFHGSIALVGEEPLAPYQRPPLSKKYLAGALERERLAIHRESLYAEHGVQLFLGRRAARVDRAARKVALEDRVELPYDALVLATGSRPRVPPLPGVGLGGVHTLRTVADADAIRAELTAAKSVVVVGGGYIGLEVAATCRELGREVTVLEMADRVMNRVVCPAVSAFYQGEHARHGVRIVLNARVEALSGDSRVRAVRCAGGAEYPADLVVIGVGVAPADELARECGIECANGIVVDEHGRTSDPSIFAAGDCTNHPSPHYGRRVRLESVDGAFEQGTNVALNLLGTASRYDKVPWFWSDQYDLKLLIVGLALDHEEVVLRGDPATRSFSACYLRNGELVAIDTVNSPRDQMAARRLIAARARLDRAKVADPTVALKDCAR